MEFDDTIKLCWTCPSPNPAGRVTGHVSARHRDRTRQDLLDVPTPSILLNVAKPADLAGRAWCNFYESLRIRVRLCSDEPGNLLVKAEILIDVIPGICAVPVVIDVPVVEDAGGLLSLTG